MNIKVISWNVGFSPDGDYIGNVCVSKLKVKEWNVGECMQAFFKDEYNWANDMINWKVGKGNGCFVVENVDGDIRIVIVKE